MCLPFVFEYLHYFSCLLLKDDRDIAVVIIKYLMTPVYYIVSFTRKCTDRTVQILTQLQVIQMPPTYTFCVFTEILSSSIHKTCLHSIDYLIQTHIKLLRSIIFNKKTVEVLQLI
jgi:hypothetical protein